MNFLNLKYFLAAAEELNFTRAAKNLYITQQSLSNHIAKLEDYFGVKLFDRTPPITLTEAGQSLLENARAILSMRDQTEQEINDIRDFRSGSLTIGVTHARGTVVMPALFAAFHKEFPSVHLHLFEGTSGEIEEALYKGKVDMTLGFLPEDPANVVSEILLKERSVIVVPKQILEEYFPDNPFGNRNPDDRFSLKLFADCPFVTIHPATWAGAIFDNCCLELGISPKVMLQTANVMTMVSLCLEGMGVIVCPEIFISQYNNSPVCAQRLESVEIFPLDYAPSENYISINYLKGKYLPKVSREFIRIAKDLLQEQEN